MESLHANTETNCHPQLARKRKKSLQRRFVWTGGGGKLSKTLKRKDFHKSLHNTSPEAIFKCSTRNILCNMLYAVLILCLSCQNVASQNTNCPPDKPCFPDSENLALAGTGRNLDVSSTCGSNGVTTYTKSVLLLDNTIFQCDATNDTIKHPKEYMVDTVTEQITLTAGSAPVSYESPNAITYWQSDNSITENNGVPSAPEIEWIVLNLTDPFLIRYIRIVYVSPHITGEDAVSDMRPKAICIERKMNQDDAEWLPWRYYAEDCPTAFLTVSHQTGNQATPATTAVCIQKYYATDSSTYIGTGFGRQEVCSQE